MERDIATWEDLDERLRRMEHFIQNPPGPPLRLVIIDSIAHLFSDSVDFQAGKTHIAWYLRGLRQSSRSFVPKCSQILHSSCKVSSLLAVVISSRSLQAAMQSAQRSCSGWQGY